ncbi:MAG: helix-turn-helix transcriptional regulator [Oscillospiraceae bacterium]|nr:helix-turn-helix transcriptional regulator [Oscillospiraceae bacterium]
MEETYKAMIAEMRRIMTLGKLNGKKITYKKLADATGCRYSTISAMFEGYRSGKNGTLDKIFSVLKEAEKSGFANF